MSQTPPTFQPPDVRQLDEQELAEAPFPGGAAQGLRVYLTPEVYETLRAHALEDTSVEICGVLVGSWARDAGGSFLRISDAIRGEAARNRIAEVTFTHETWARINEEMDRRFVDSALVGWYHTHPDFGVFLSDRDRFIQEHFFSGPGQIALVIDPVRRTVGAFAWRDGKPALCPYFWVGDRVVAATAAGDESPAAPALEPAAPARPAASAGGPSPRAWLTQALAYLALFLLGSLWAGSRSSWEEARLVEGVVAHYGLFKGLRPGLHEALGALDGRLRAVTRGLGGLSADHLRRLRGEGAAQDQLRQWEQALRDLADAEALVGELDRAYSLTPEESGAVEKLVLKSLLPPGEPRAAAGQDRPGSPVGVSAVGGGGTSTTPVAKPPAPRTTR